MVFDAFSVYGLWKVFYDNLEKDNRNYYIYNKNPIVIYTLSQILNFENNLIKDYYSSKDINGYEFAYTNPGINKIFQALGRVVRTENDRGSALIIDSRYKQTNYKKAFLSRYKNSKIVSSTAEIEEVLKSFYKN